MPRVVHFEIHADEPERAVSSYNSVFGWKFQKWEGPLEHWMIITGAEGTPGINGGTIVVPKMPIPGGAWLVYAKDTEGNIFGVHQEDPVAG